MRETRECGGWGKHGTPFLIRPVPPANHYEFLSAVFETAILTVHTLNWSPCYYSSLLLFFPTANYQTLLGMPRDNMHHLYQLMTPPTFSLSFKCADICQGLVPDIKFNFLRSLGLSGRWLVGGLVCLACGHGGLVSVSELGDILYS